MQTLRPGSFLQGGRYRIIETLGQGGFGITYLAFQSGLERKVAVKEFFMRDFCERDSDSSRVTLGTKNVRDTVNRFREKFLKEARTIAKLKHPNIISIFDVFEENDTAYYVMEYAEGGSLAAKVSDMGRLSESMAKRYILQVADALAYIHGQKMNHLDIKPANIMLNENDEALLIDFGLAKQYDVLTGEQTSTTPVGYSEGYAPMEQYRKGGVGAFSPETDIYALGATFFKLLTGSTPPSASDINEDGVPVDELKAVGASQSAIDGICTAMKSRRKDRIKDVQIFINGLKEDVKEVKEVPIVTKDPNVTVLDPEILDAYPPKAEEPIIEEKKPYEIFQVNGVTFKMILVNGGTFMMGATEEQGTSADSDEKPAHQVTLSDYYIGETVVTQALWQAVMGKNPSRFTGNINCPVERVSWNDCQKFILKLNKLTRCQFRLPTESEWEYAARGGNKGSGKKYAGSNLIETYAWYWENSDNKTHPVKTKSPNELGLYDMSGNVWEWCQDWYDSYNSNAQHNPQGPARGSHLVIRGGSWVNGNRYCRVSCRNFRSPKDTYNHLGLRLAL